MRPNLGLSYIYPRLWNLRLCWLVYFRCQIDWVHSIQHRVPRFLWHICIRTRAKQHIRGGQQHQTMHSIGASV